MQAENQIEQVHSLVPINYVSNQHSLQRKHWHVIASAEMMIPQLTFSLRITQILLMFDMKIYISIEIAIIPMVGPSHLKLEYNGVQQIKGYDPIQSSIQYAAIGSGLYELPVCARCFLGYSCKTHSHK